MEQMPVAEVLQRLGGTAATRELLLHVSRRALQAAVEAGAVRQLRRGCYGLPELPPARRAAALLSGAASHTSAAAAWGFESLLPLTTTRVTVRPNAHPQRLRGVRTSWAPLSSDELAAGVTAPLRTVVDCAASLPFDQGLAIADSALRQGAVTASELEDAAAAHRGNGAASARRVARWASDLAANPFESAVRAVALDAGLTGFRPQVPLPLASGWVRADLVDQDLRMVQEADSFTWHGDRQALARDCRRYDEMVRADYVVLRVAWEQAMFEQAWLREVMTGTAALRRTAREDRRRREASGARAGGASSSRSVRVRAGGGAGGRGSGG